MKPIVYKNVKQGLYLIDEYGNIYSNYKKGYLKPGKDKDGYIKISLSCGHKKDKCTIRVATLVAYHYLGIPPKELKSPTIDHIDGNKSNNYYKNLRWIERGENSAIRSNKPIGQLNHFAKLNEKQVLEICELLLNTSYSNSQIAQQYGVSASCIALIAQHKNWKELTKNYNFSNRQVVRNDKGQFEVLNISFTEEGK